MDKSVRAARGHDATSTVNLLPRAHARVRQSTDHEGDGDCGCGCCCVLGWLGACARYAFMSIMLLPWVLLGRWVSVVVDWLRDMALLGYVFIPYGMNIPSYTLKRHADRIGIKDASHAAVCVHAYACVEEGAQQQIVRAARGSAPATVYLVDWCFPVWVFYGTSANRGTIAPPRAADAWSGTESRRGKRVVFLHGNATNALESATALQVMANELGAIVVAPDFGGYWSGAGTDSWVDGWWWCCFVRRWFTSDGYTTHASSNRAGQCSAWLAGRLVDGAVGQRAEARTLPRHGDNGADDSGWDDAAGSNALLTVNVPRSKACALHGLDALNALGVVQPDDQGGDEDVVFAANMMDTRVLRGDAAQDGAPGDSSDATNELGGVAYRDDEDATGTALAEQDSCIVVWGESIGVVAASRLAVALGKRCSGLFLDSGFVSGFDVYFDQWATSRAWIDERVAVFTLWRKKGSPAPTRSLGYVPGAGVDARAAAPPIAFEAEAAPMHVGRSHSCCVDAFACAPVREFISNADTVPRLECPVVFLHAWGDRVVPATHSLALFSLRVKADKGDTGLVLFNANCHGVAGAAFRSGAKSAWDEIGGVRKVVELFNACCNE